MRDRAAQDEAARLQPDDLVDPLAGIGVQQLVDRHPEPARIGEQRGHVAKQDPVMREVDDGADVVLDGFLAWGGPQNRVGFGYHQPEHRIRATKAGQPSANQIR